MRRFGAVVALGLALGCGRAEALNSYCITTTGSGTVAASTLTGYNAANSDIYVFSGGAKGANAAAGTGGAGGGSGGYAHKHNQALSGTISFNVGIQSGGATTTGETWFGGTNLATSFVGIQGAGTAPTGAVNTGATGTDFQAGANGGAGGLGLASGGGAGAPGKDGAAIAGGNGSGTTGGAGGTGNNGSGGTPGAGGTTTTAATIGGAGAELGASSCSNGVVLIGATGGSPFGGGGGGGGSALSTNLAGKAAGNYGAGGGGEINGAGQGNGTQGAILITWTPAATSTGQSCTLLGVC